MYYVVASPAEIWSLSSWSTETQTAWCPSPTEVEKVKQCQVHCLWITQAATSFLLLTGYYRKCAAGRTDPEPCQWFRVRHKEVGWKAWDTKGRNCGYVSLNRYVNTMQLTVLQISFFLTIFHDLLDLICNEHSLPKLTMIVKQSL